MDGVVVGCRDDTFVREDETGDHRTAVCGEGNMFRVKVIDPFSASEVA